MGLLRTLPVPCPWTPSASTAGSPRAWQAGGRPPPGPLGPGHLRPASHQTWSSLRSGWGGLGPCAQNGLPHPDPRHRCRQRPRRTRTAHHTLRGASWREGRPRTGALPCCHPASRLEAIASRPAPWPWVGPGWLGLLGPRRTTRARGRARLASTCHYQAARAWVTARGPGPSGIGGPQTAATAGWAPPQPPAPWCCCQCGGRSHPNQLLAHPGCHRHPFRRSQGQSVPWE